VDKKAEVTTKKIANKKSYEKKINKKTKK